MPVRWAAILAVWAVGVALAAVAGLTLETSATAAAGERAKAARASEGPILGALRRVNKKGRKVKHKLVEKTGSRVTRSAGRARPGSVVFYRAVINRAEPGAVFRFVVRKARGFRKAKVRSLRAGGTRCGKARMRKVGGRGAWVVKCKTRPFSGRRWVIFAVKIPSRTKTGTLLVWLTSGDVVKEGAVEVAIGKKKPKPPLADDDGSNGPPVRPEGGEATEADCPQQAWQVTTAFGPKTLVFHGSDEPSSSQVGCIYKDQGGGTTQMRIDIIWTPGSSRPVNVAGDCADGPGTVRRSGNRWESLNRQLEASLTVTVRVDSPNQDQVMTDLVETLERKGVGAPCPSSP